MRTTVFALGILGMLGAAACSPAEPGQPVFNNNPQPSSTLPGDTPPGGTLPPGVQPPITPGATPGVQPPLPPATTPGVQPPAAPGTTPGAPGTTPVPSATDPGGTSEPCKEGDNLALIHTNGNWIGCDPALSTDNPGGVQGAFYLYGDGTSCDDKAIPCDDTGCHLKGTSIDGDPGEDWGCGLGLGLNTTETASGESVKQPYTGATCF